MNKELIFVKSKIEIRTINELIGLKKLKGVVLTVGPDAFEMLDEDAKIIEVKFDNILYIKKASFDRYVLECLNKLFKAHEKIREELSTLEQLSNIREKYEKMLEDAHLISNFNVDGSIRNLEIYLDSECSIPPGEYKYTPSGRIKYNICNDDEKVLICISIKKDADINAKDITQKEFDKQLKELKEECIIDISEKAKQIFKSSMRVDFTSDHIKHINKSEYIFESKYYVYYNVFSDNFSDRKKEILVSLNEFIKLL